MSEIASRGRWIVLGARRVRVPRRILDETTLY